MPEELLRRGRGRRVALLVTATTYADPSLKALNAPQADARALAAVLGDPTIGDYQVEVLADKMSQDVRVRINKLFVEADRDDLVLLYFSGHGIRDMAGRLHLATVDTQSTLLASTAVSANFIRELIDHSSSRRVVVWLDCCYAGAFPAGVVPKAGERVDVQTQLNGRSGRGCVVMSASTAIQFAFERGGKPDVRGGVPSSIFTQAIVEGLNTGDADLNGDGEIDTAELYNYVYDWVVRELPEQTPTRNDMVTGEFPVAHNKKGPRSSLDTADVVQPARRGRSLGGRVALIVGVVVALTLMGTFITAYIREMPSSGVPCAAGDVAILGSTSFGPVARELSDRYQKACPSARIDTAVMGSLTGLQQLGSTDGDGQLVISDGAVEAGDVPHVDWKARRRGNFVDGGE